MGLLDSLLQRMAGRKPEHGVFLRHWTDEGVVFGFKRPLEAETTDALVAVADKASAADTFLAAYLAQLVMADRSRLTRVAAIIPWATLYELRHSAEHAGVIEALNLPEERDLKPVLASTDTLADASFGVHIDGWVLDSAEVTVQGAIGGVATADGQEVLLPFDAWRTLDSIKRFEARSPDHRTQHENELAWGSIRAFADAAGTFYRTPYLETTYVLTPQTLRLPLKREDTPFGRVFTVEPTFEGAPAGWLKAFDGFNSVQPHYDLTHKGGGHVRVVISEPVRQVLSVIKREMQARRVAGSRAERFIHNPWAFLGEAAHEVLREEDFAADRAAAGALAAVFSIAPRMPEGRIETVDLIVTEHFNGGTARTETAAFGGPDELAKFVDELVQALELERQRFAWKEYDLTLDGEATVQLEYARQALHLWRTQPAERISFEDIYELEGYSGRIEGIGPAKAIYVPVVQKPSSEDEGKPGWLPTDLTPMVKVTLAGHEGQVVLPLTREWVDEFEAQVRDAEKSGASEVQNTSLPTAMETTQARTLVDGFRTMLDAQAKVKPDGSGKAKRERLKKETLLVKLNFFGVDYAEERRMVLALPSGAKVELPSSLRQSIELKKHQLNGIAWFQHLVARGPAYCRGALLADDMGLGKTLQLLTVVAWYYERNRNAAPSIILAPKSLVENWAAETKKFFTPSFPEVLVLYGDELQKRKQPLGLIDEQLHSRGVIDLLKPGWVGRAKVVVTTYEVLTSYEFSLARQPFAFAICDEAQRIKTPGTNVTNASRALKADFRIACTGTPVENSLADLWCLFDFVQPGLLGGLEEFGRVYRRPIECETDEQLAMLAKLQDAIAPQTLRRTKLDIAGELPKKYFARRSLAGGGLNFKESLELAERLEVPMSAHQSNLYLGGLKKLQDAASESDGRKRARLSFGALHLMKAVCAEPYCLPGMKFMPDKNGHERHLQNSPKLAWLVEHLHAVKAAGEKAIIFTELREVQAALFYFLREEFGLKPHIINGDSQNRQSYITRFEETTGFNVIILSTLAAGAGLNVTAANHVFHFTRAWNPAKESQATDRAYRIGQARDVYVYCPVLVAEGFITFDVRLDELLRRKAGLADATIGGSAMLSMLNGSGRDVSFTELVGTGGGGKAPERRYLVMDDVDRMDWFRFEVLCRLLWSKAGYSALLTPKRGGDGGVDIVALKGREGVLVQCKSSANAELGWDAIKEVAAGAASYQAQYPNARFRRVPVTNRSFNGTARHQSEMNRVSLIERSGLEELLGQHPVSNIEFEDEVAQAGLSYDESA
jgi:HJR/Mrr/RecB family endonuclease